MEHELLLETLNKLEEKIKARLKNLTKDYTKEQLEKEYEIAKNNLNNYSSNENLSKKERYRNWTELETIYNFYAGKLEKYKGE